MSDSDIPSIKVLIKPLFDSAQNITTLYVSFTITATKVDGGHIILSFPNNLKDVQMEHEGSKQAINLSPGEIKEHGIAWYGRTSFKLFYKAILGPPFDLRCEQGGLLGSGLSFIPIPKTKQVYRNIVEWDLSLSPEGTRSVWTFGEGSAPIEKVGPASLLSESVYMVGPIQSNPPVQVGGTMPDYYGYYWFGDLPPNIAVIKDIHHDFFVKVSDFFQDPPSATNPYRTFVRNTTPTKSFGGKNHLRSHIFSYDDKISVAHDYDLVRRMAYEMIHNFLGPSVSDNEIDWLFEGIKNTLSIYLPFRTGFRTSDYFESTMAMHSMKYYTSPLINLTHEEALSLAPTNAYARELVSARAWAFVILTDFRTRKVAEGKRPDLMPRPAEDMAIKPLALKKRNEEPHGIEQWIELLQPLMGNEVRELYKHMREGGKIVLPERFFGPTTHRMATVQQEKLDFGMDRESLEVSVVKGLKEGSRAEKAGLKEGDRIVRSSHAWRCVDTFEAEMELVVEREGVEKTITYWPRSIEKVECLTFIKLD